MHLKSERICSYAKGLFQCETWVDFLITNGMRADVAVLPEGAVFTNCDLVAAYVRKVPNLCAGSDACTSIDDS